MYLVLASGNRKTRGEGISFMASVSSVFHMVLCKFRAESLGPTYSALVLYCIVNCLWALNLIGVVQEAHAGHDMRL